MLEQVDLSDLTANRQSRTAATPSEYARAMTRIETAAKRIGPNGLETLAIQAERLAAGAVKYADDMNDGRDWGLEALEEMIDTLSYLTRELIRMRGGR